MGKELEVTDNSLKGLLTEGITVVRFTAHWCEPCPMIARIIEKLANTANFVKCDVDVNKDLTQKFFVINLPHIVILDRDENILTTHIGDISEEALTDLIDEATAKLNP